MIEIIRLEWRTEDRRSVTRHTSRIVHLLRLV